MALEYNLYCDESCHLQNDHQKTMVLGAIWAEKLEAAEASTRIKELKQKHGLKASQEVKWTKISPSNTPLYLDLIDYFFDNSNLNFRGLIIPDKSVIDHSAHDQTHDDWYYKMYFLMLTAVLRNDSRYNIYLDIKDTRGGSRVEKLHSVLANAKFDFERQLVKKVQLIRSHEVQLIQLADILIGALMYKHRGEFNSDAKRLVVERIEQRSGLSLVRSTLLTEANFNLLVWKPGGIEL